MADDPMSIGSGIILDCKVCGTRRELTANEVTCAPTPSEAATKVLEADGWDMTRSVCDECVAEEQEAAKMEADKEAADTTIEQVEDEDDTDPERPDFELAVKAAPKLQAVAEVIEEPKPAEPVVIIEEKDVRIVLTTDSFDGGPPEPILIVERAHSVKDAMGNKRYTNIGLTHTVWVIQELARALYERETGQQDAPPQNRVWLGSSRYIPLPNIID